MIKNLKILFRACGLRRAWTCQSGGFLIGRSHGASLSPLSGFYCVSFPNQPGTEKPVFTLPQNFTSKFTTRNPAYIYA